MSMAGFGKMSAVAAMMGGDGGAIELPRLNVPCAVCTVRSLDPTAAALGEGDNPALSVTMVAGTPVCASHGADLLGALMGRS